MFKLRVTNNKGQEIYAINSGTQELLAPELLKYPLPAPYVWATLTEAVSLGVVIPENAEAQPRIVQVEVEVPSEVEGEEPTIEMQDQEVTEYKIYDYYVTVTDTTTEDAAAAKEQKRIENEAFGKGFTRWMSMLNESSNISPAQVIALRNDPRIKMANDLANGGDIISLKYHIENTNWDGLFPEAVKTAALVKINEYLAG